MRIKYIDIAKGMGIFLVVFTHTPMFFDVNAEMSKVVIWVGAFHMPLFAYLYGYTAKENQLIGIKEKKEFVKKIFVYYGTIFYLGSNLCSIRYEISILYIMGNESIIGNG